MSEWIPQSDDFSSEVFSDVEDLLRLAADELPVVRSGLKTEIVTRAQSDQRLVRSQHILWGAATMLLFSLGALIFWPLHSPSSLASESPSPKPVNASLIPATDTIGWDLVESETRLREQKREILQNAF